MCEDHRKLEPGTWYKVTLHDCCIEGELVGVFHRLEELVGQDNGFTHPDDVGKVYGYRYHFDFGYIGPEWGQWKAEPLKTAVDSGEGA